jgi:hypothetical protein
MSFYPSAVSYRLSAISYWLSAITPILCHFDPPEAEKNLPFPFLSFRAEREKRAFSETTPPLSFRPKGEI